MKRKTLWLTLIPFGIFSCISFLLLDRCPPLNGDEITQAVIGVHFLKTGEISYPLYHQVIDPAFESLASVSQDGLRPIYMTVLGVWQKVFGSHFLGLRTLFFLLWLVIAALLFNLVREKVGPPSAVIILYLWMFSLDGFLSSHLVRPDIMLALSFLIAILLVSKNPLSLKRLFLAGFIAGASFGIHIHGLIVPIALIPFVVSWKRRSWMIGASVLGALLTLAFADIPSVILSNHSVLSQVFIGNSSAFAKRLLPYNLLADAAINILQPLSFYWADNLKWDALWWPAGVATFAIYVFCGFYAWFKSENTFLRASCVSAAAVFLFIGLGHLRADVTYNLPISILLLPAIAFVISDGFLKVKRSSTPLILILSIALMTILACWLFRFILPFYLIALLITMNLAGVSDRKVLLTGGLGAVLFFCLRMRSKEYLELLNRNQWMSFQNRGGVGLIIALGVLALIVLAQYRTLVKIPKSAFSSLITLSILLGGLSIASASMIYHVGWIATHNRPLSSSADAFKSIVGKTDEKILGPSIFWFDYPDKTRDIGAFLMDFYYSGQKRPWQCIERYQPGILVIDDEFRRRFVRSGDFKLQVPYSFLGMIPGNLNHTDLEIYRLDWKNNPTPAAPKRG